MTEKNIEYQSLLQFADDLTQLIQHNVVSVSSKLFAKGLVAKDVHDSVLSVDGASNQSKAAKLLSCVLDKIKESGDQCQYFIDVLGEDSYFDNIVLKLTKVREILQGCKDDPVESEERKQVAVVDSKVEKQQIKDKEEVGKQIKHLEKIFLSLKKMLLKELKADKEVTTEVLLESLTILPTELQTEYGAYLEEKLPVLEELGTVSKIFSRLSLHFTFLDYALLQHLIDEFGSEHLKQDMSAYDREIQVFLNETTIPQLQDHLPGRQELPPHFDKLQMRIDKDPGKCSLQMVNDLRKRFCNETQLSEIVFVLIGIGKANSFVLIFMVPSVLGPTIVDSISSVDDSFYQRECIVSILLNQQQLYLSLALREKAEYEERLMVLCASNVGDIQEFTYLLSQPGVDPDICDQSGRTLLHLASYTGNKEIVEILLDSGAVVNKGDKMEFTSLHLASFNGHKEVVELLLNRGADVDKVNMIGTLTSQEYDMTALVIAAIKNHEEIVDMLLKAGANPNIINREGLTALMEATKLGHKNIVKALLERKADTSITDENGRRLIHLASQNGHRKVVELLLDSGAVVDEGDKEGITPLHLASFNGHKEVVELLLDRGASVDKVDEKYGATALIWAATEGCEQVVDVLLNAGANPDIRSRSCWTPLIEATKGGHKNTVEALVGRKADTNITDMDGRTALHRASLNGSKDFVELLIDSDADVDKEDEEGVTPLHLASFNGHKEVVEFLIDRGASVHKTDKVYGASALHRAAQEGHEQVVDVLLKAGADPDTILDQNGRTSLHLASQNGHKEVIEVLLNSGAVVDKADKEGITSLHLSSHDGREEVVELLLDRGASVHKIDKKYGMTGLTWAAYGGHKQIVDILLKARSNPDTQDHITGGTALHHAALNGHVESIKVLLEGGANMEIKDKKGMTAHDIGSIAFHPEVCQLLEQYGYKPSPAFLQSSRPTSRDCDRIRVTSLKTFRHIMKHGSTLSNVPVKHQTTHHALGVPWTK